MPSRGKLHRARKAFAALFHKSDPTPKHETAKYLTRSSSNKRCRAQTQQQSAREFASVEELIREDARQTLVPPGIAQRLRKSSAELPQPARPWWRRLFNR